MMVGESSGTVMWRIVWSLLAPSTLAASRYSLETPVSPALKMSTLKPITFQAVDATHPTGGIFTDDRKDLSSYGTMFDTTWVTVHDTAVDTSGKPYDANAAAKAAGATPFKRPP